MTLAAETVATDMPSPRKSMTFLAILVLGVLARSLLSWDWAPACQGAAPRVWSFSGRALDALDETAEERDKRKQSQIKSFVAMFNYL